MSEPSVQKSVQAGRKGWLVKLATYSVNGVNGRLDVLLRWLDVASPDVVCLQELKAPDTRFPRRESSSQAMASSGTATRLGTALQSLPGLSSRSKHVAVCPVTLTTNPAVTLKQLLMG